MQPAEVSEEKFRKFAYQYADSLNLLSEERRGKSEKFICSSLKQIETNEDRNHKLYKLSSFI